MKHHHLFRSSVAPDGPDLGRDPSADLTGPGRPGDQLRQACALAFEQRIAILKKIAEGKVPDTRTRDRLKAVELRGRHGGLQKLEPEAEGPQTIHVVYY